MGKGKQDKDFARQQYERWKQQWESKMRRAELQRPADKEASFEFDTGVFNDDVTSYSFTDLYQAINQLYGQQNSSSGGDDIMANKFKPGDRVVINSSRGDAYVGCKGTIVSYDYDGIYWVDFDQGQYTQGRSRWNVKYLDLLMDSAQAVVDFDSVILADEKKKQILEALGQIDKHDLIFKQWGFGGIFEKGTAVSLLFYGEPGTGKTLMAQAIADKYKKKLQRISTAEIESSEPGGAERAIKQYFENAGEDTILLFDECDSLLYNRRDVGSILAAQVNQLLQSLENYKGIAIFTTNRLGTLDEALNRRLSLKLEFTLPDKAERVKIWQRMFPDKAPLADDVDFEELASVGITGGYIKNIVIRAVRAAACEDIPDKEKQIRRKHLVQALKHEVRSMVDFEDAAEPGKPRPVSADPGIRRTGGEVRRTVTMDKEKAK